MFLSYYIHLKHQNVTTEQKLDCSKISALKWQMFDKEQYRLDFYLPYNKQNPWLFNIIHGVQYLWE